MCFLINKLKNINILIIGDMVADVYLKGNISRVSREAPVLVLEHAGEKVVPGGAANVVHNVATLGGQAFAVGLIGNDKAGSGLRDILNDKNSLSFTQSYDLDSNSVYDQDYTWYRDLHCLKASLTYRAKRDEIKFRIGIKEW